MDAWVTLVAYSCKNETNVLTASSVVPKPKEILRVWHFLFYKPTIPFLLASSTKCWSY